LLVHAQTRSEALGEVGWEVSVIRHTIPSGVTSESVE
jgi:hypothetical protein